MLKNLKNMLKKEVFNKKNRIVLLEGVFMIGQEVINEIRKSVDIVDIISSYIPLTQKGKNYFGVCPFHDDHSPSMSVSKEKQIYTCFSCGATGNVFKFVMDYENISFVEAIKMLADKAGISVDVNTKTRKNNNSNLYDIYEIATKFYQNNINTSLGGGAREYLKKRNIDDDVIKTFKIGLSLKENKKLETLLRSKKYTNDDLIKSGLILKNEYGYIDIYKNRIMFPLSDLNGQVVGFSGRIYEGTDTSKYINTKETEIFKKGHILYNYKLAKDEARTTDTVIVMEGFMDVIRAYTIGIKNVVATMGTAVTKEHAMLLKKMAKNVILCFDGDGAGEKATVACINELIKIGVTPKIVRLEDNLDPDDYIISKGKDAFLNKINNPINIMDFKFMYYKSKLDLNNSVDMANYVNNIIDELNKINDDVLKEISIKKICLETKLDEEFIRSKLITKEIPKEIKIVQPKKLNNCIEAEQKLLYNMLRHKEVIVMLNKSAVIFPDEKYRKLFNEINCFYKEYKEINIADFITYINNDEDMLKTVGEIETVSNKEDLDIEEIQDYIKVIRNNTVQLEINRLKKLQKEETDEKKKEKIGMKILDLCRSDEDVK